MQYVKVAFKKEGKGLFTYKPDKLYEANKWDPTASDPREFGGFNFSTPEKILRWIFRGDTLYDVEIPEGAEVQEIESASAPHGIFRSNKIVLRNPRPITDDVAYELYMHSDLPWKSYIQSACGCAIRGHWNTAFNILDNNITNENRDEAIQIIKDWCHPGGEV